MTSFWNIPYFPEWCRDTSMDDVLDDTLIRVAGSWAGFGEAFCLIMNTYQWHQAIVVSDDGPGSCYYGASSIAEHLKSPSAVAANFSVTWIRLQTDPTDADIEYTLDQIRDRFRSEHSSYFISAQRLLKRELVSRAIG
jgi:mannitol-specific phosphotransferase system IIBC component